MQTNEELFLAGDMETLYTRNIPFMFYVARKFSNLPMEEEDLIGCGNLAFTKCLRVFDPSKSKWLTLFNQIMMNEILMAYRKMKRSVNGVSIENMIHNDGNQKELSLKEVLASQIGNMDEAMDHLIAGEILDKMKTFSVREQKIILQYLAGRSQIEIAKEMGVSQSQISRLIKKVIGNLREFYKRGA